MLKVSTPTPIQKIAIGDDYVELSMKREDQIHDQVSGNKWRKLKYNLENIRSLGGTRVLTFGGAYSNHIYAVAAASNELGLESIGVIRGDRVEPLNPTLSYAESKGMTLRFMDRSAYRDKDESIVLEQLKDEFGSFHLIPEGGTNQVALKGVREMAEEIPDEYDIVCCPVGTGGTLAGVISAGKQAQVIGFPALRGALDLSDRIQDLLNESDAVSHTEWQLVHDFHFGGYARYTEELVNFINEFKVRNQVPLDPVYTGKMMFGIQSMIADRRFKPGSRILAIHTGGLQGIAGFNQRFGDLLK